MKEEEKALSGKLFCPGHPDLKAMKLKAHKLNHAYNALYEDQVEERNIILKELIGELGQRSFLQEPITFHYGVHTRIGEGTFINFNLTIQDDAYVTIGNNCNLGPNVTIVTPIHPTIAEERNLMEDSDGQMKHLIYAKPVTIGDNCWFGANVVVCPGVTIGDNCIIGAGSIVTRDIPGNTIAVGNPCRVLREITEEDSLKKCPELFCIC